METKTDSEVNQELIIAQIKSLHKKVDNLSEKVDHSFHGNGQPGAFHRITKVETTIYVLKWVVGVVVGIAAIVVPIALSK